MSTAPPPIIIKKVAPVVPPAAAPAPVVPAPAAVAAVAPAVVPAPAAVAPVVPTKTKKKSGFSGADFLADISKPKKGDNGEEVSFIFGDNYESTVLDAPFYISTGLKVVDIILGKGGFGTGKIVEIYGPKSSGKSELSQLLLATFLEQHPNGIGMYFDQERAVDKAKLDSRPIFKSNRCLYCWAPSAEVLFQKVEKTLVALANNSASNIPSIIVIDSVAALITASELDNVEYNKAVSDLAKILSTMFRRINPILPKTNCLLVLVNQTRATFGGGWGGVAEGSDEETPGGKAIKFYADYRVSVSAIGKWWASKTQQKKDKGRPPDGQLVKIRTVKNKLSPPFREVVVPLLYNNIQGEQGLSDVWGAWNVMKARKFIESSGSAGYSLKTQDGSKDKRTKFSLAEWKGVYKGTTYPELQPAVQKALSQFEDWAMNVTSLSSLSETDEDEDDDISADDELATLVDEDDDVS